ncbi:MAG TPA: CdaR family protein, partial [Candidatus Dormibacteraeota bacterium]|nr:CdaR family protein [Candidatus Dormibacteraeota bacterium]
MKTFEKLRSAGPWRNWQAPQWISRNLRVKLLAILLALASWVVVVYAANPPDSRQILVHVQQDSQQLPGSFVLAHSINDIGVRVSGTREHVDAFQNSSIHATPNFDAIRHTGVQQLALTVVNTDPNVDLSDAPSTVTADVDVLGSTSVPVQVRTSRVQVGYQIDHVTTVPDRVQLIGPQRELGIAQAVVDVNLGNRTLTLTQDGIPVLVVDPRSGNKPLTDVTVKEGTVRVTVVIKPVDGTLVSTVLPQLIGQVAFGHVLIGVQADPQTVTLSGPQDLINGYQLLPTVQIQITGLAADRTFAITLDAPKGLLFALANG